MANGFFANYQYVTSGKLMIQFQIFALKTHSFPIILSTVAK